MGKLGLTYYDNLISTIKKVLAMDESYLTSSTKYGNLVVSSRVCKKLRLLEMTV